MIGTCVVRRVGTQPQPGDADCLHPWYRQHSTGVDRVYWSVAYSPLGDRAFIARHLRLRSDGWGEWQPWVVGPKPDSLKSDVDRAAEAFPVEWLPATTRYRNSSTELYAVDLRSGGATHIAELPEESALLGFSEDGQRLIVKRTSDSWVLAQVRNADGSIRNESLGSTYSCQILFLDAATLQVIMEGPRCERSLGATYSPTAIPIARAGM